MEWYQLIGFGIFLNLFLGISTMGFCIKFTPVIGVGLLIFTACLPESLKIQWYLWPWFLYGSMFWSVIVYCLLKLDKRLGASQDYKYNKRMANIAEHNQLLVENCWRDIENLSNWLRDNRPKELI